MADTAGASPTQAPVKLLNDGNKIPILALGTYGKDEDINRMRQAVLWAIEAGYRHIDTAEFYRDEQQIGEGIADALEKGLVTRDELFITTKLWQNHHARDQVVPTLRDSLKRLGLDYVDLYLIHSPVAWKTEGSFVNIDYLETWQGMEDAKKLGLTKSIGRSNFNSKQIDRILSNCEIKPVVNEIEVNPTLTQEALISYCKSVGIEVMAYSPLGFMVSRDVNVAIPPAIDDPELTKIAQKYGKSTIQVVLRYLVKDDGSLKNVDYLETWRGMEHAWKQGLAKSIGLSNFNSEQIGRILTYCDVKPVVNEIEVNPTLTQEALVSYCRSVGLEVMAYSPFGFMVFRNKTEAPPPTIHDPALTRMAEKYGKSTSQIVLRYLIDRGTIPIPKSTNEERIKQNIDIFDFHLTDDEIATINEFNRNIRVIDLESLKDSPYYPFNSP